MKRKIKNQQPIRARKAQPTAPKLDHTKPFIEHLYELRHRLFLIAVSVVLFSVLGYMIQQQLVHVLLRPAHGQQFIYTSPIGGLNFLFQVCLYFGVLLSTPAILYQILRYLEPLIREHTRSTVIRYTTASGLLAIIGGGFGYFVGLPIALRFLSHQFTSSQIKPLLAIQDYMSFVIVYLLGSALLFQLPLIINIINRIKPLKPSKLIAFERYMVLLAFVAAAIMIPTTDVVIQLMFAVPIILMYQVAVLMVYLKNRGKPESKTHSVDVQFMDGEAHQLTVMVKIPVAKKYKPLRAVWDVT